MSDNDQNPKTTNWLYLLIACILIAIPFLIYRFLVLGRLSHLLSE